MRIRLPGDREADDNIHKGTGAGAHPQNKKETIGDRFDAAEAEKLKEAKDGQLRLANALKSIPKGLPEDMRVKLANAILTGSGYNTGMRVDSDRAADYQAAEIAFYKEKAREQGARKEAAASEIFDDFHAELKKGKFAL